VRQDRARVQIGKITRFGLLEMSRQRLRPSLGESSYMTCPRCSGIGNIRSVESLALAILRIIGEEARKERTAKVIAQLPVEVATYLLNEKRNWVQSLESRNDTQVILVANSALETPHYQIRRVRDDQAELPENAGTSYTLAELSDEPDALSGVAQERKVAEPAAVATITPTAAPVRKVVEQKRPGLLSRLFSLFSGSEESEPQQTRERSDRSGKKRDARGGQRTRRRSEPQRTEPRSTRSSKAGRKRGGKGSADDSSRPGRSPAERGPADNSSPDRKSARSSTESTAGTGAEAAGTRTEGRKDSRDETRRSPGKRRSRGGRRRKRADTGETSESADNQQRGEATQQASPDQNAPAGRPPREGSSPRRRSNRNRTDRPGDTAASGNAGDRQAESTSASELSAVAFAVPGQANGAGVTADRTPPAAAARVDTTDSRPDAERAEQLPPMHSKDDRPDERQALSSRDDWSSYGDTQPELPIVRSPESRPSELQSSSVASSTNRSEPLDAPRSLPADSPGEPQTLRQAQDRATAEAALRRTATPERAPEADVTRPPEKPAETPSLKSNGAPGHEDKAAGRLLPWEPLEEHPDSAGLTKPDEKADRSDSER
jgi:ribonuclease E